MQRRNNTGGSDKEEQGRHENPLPQEISQQEYEINKAAHDDAIEDIEHDPDLSLHNPNDDLDEGESARLGEGENPLI